VDVVSCRKKRKWDQPAEAVAPAAYPVSAIVPYTSSPSTAPNNVTAAIVQKINQVPLLSDQKHYAWLVARLLLASFSGREGSRCTSLLLH
jgi:hypothetical protein